MERVTVEEQRAYIKIETLRGKTSTEIHRALQEACQESSLDRSTVSRWNKRFREGRTSVKDDQRSGRPRTATDDTSAVIVATIIEEDRRLTCLEIAEEANMSAKSVHRILTEILMKRKISARWVPHLLSVEQKNARKEIAVDLLARYHREGDGFLKRIIAIDETWIRDFEPELKRQSMEWRHPSSPRPKKLVVPCQKLNSCSLLLTTGMVLFVQSQYQMDRQSIAKCICLFCAII